MHQIRCVEMRRSTGGSCIGSDLQHCGQSCVVWCLFGTLLKDKIATQWKGDKALDGVCEDPELTEALTVVQTLYVWKRSL